MPGSLIGDNAQGSQVHNILSQEVLDPEQEVLDPEVSTRRDAVAVSLRPPGQMHAF